VEHAFSAALPRSDTVALAQQKHVRNMDPWLELTCGALNRSAIPAKVAALTR
jgi:hypothetical protein